MPNFLPKLGNGLKDLCTRICIYPINRLNDPVAVENRRMEFRIDINAQGRTEVKPSQKGELSSLSKHSVDLSALEGPEIRGCRVLQKKATAFSLNAVAASMKKQ